MLQKKEAFKANWLFTSIFEIVEPKYKVLEEGSISNLKEIHLWVTLSSSLNEKRKEGRTVTPFHYVPFLNILVHLEFKIEFVLVGILTLIR